MTAPAHVRTPEETFRVSRERVPEYRILGPLEVTIDGGPVALGGPRQRAVLAIGW